MPRDLAGERMHRRDLIMYRAWGGMQVIADSAGDVEPAFLVKWLQDSVADYRASLEALADLELDEPEKVA